MLQLVKPFIIVVFSTQEMSAEKAIVPSPAAAPTTATERTTTQTNPPATTSTPPAASNGSTKTHATRGHENTSKNLDADCLLVIKIILAIIFPPLAVALECGCGCQLLLNIILTIFGYIPGLIHALFVIFHCGEGGLLVDEEEAVEGRGATGAGTATGTGVKSETVYPPPQTTTAASEPVVVKKV